MSDLKFARVFSMLFIVALLITFIFFGALCSNQTMKIFFVGNTFKDMKEDIYNHQNKRVPEDSIVFLGDSITEMYDLNRYYKGKIDNFVNRGISSETSTEVLERLETNVISLAPKKVILLIGTNDLNKGATPDEIVDNIRKIAMRIRSFNKKTEVYVESVLPVNNGAYLLSKSIVNKRLNSDIDRINEELRANALLCGYTYIDTNTPLKDNNGMLNRDYSVDGLHISKAGYAVITDTIMSYIA